MSTILASMVLALALPAESYSTSPARVDCVLCTNCSYNVEVTNLGNGKCSVSFTVQCRGGTCASTGVTTVLCASQTPVDVGCCTPACIKPNSITTWDNVLNCTETISTNC